MLDSQMHLPRSPVSDWYTTDQSSHCIHSFLTSLWPPIYTSAYKITQNINGGTENGTEDYLILELFTFLL